jgi:hypothetical protein
MKADTQHFDGSVKRFPNVNMTKSEYELVTAICKRALPRMQEVIPSLDMLSLSMDITYTHTVLPLHLSRLLDSHDLDFFHDMYGIYQNFNRETYSMDNCFLPRSALCQHKAA